MSLRIVALDDYQGLVEQMGLGERLAGELEGAGTATAPATGLLGVHALRSAITVTAAAFTVASLARPTSAVRCSKPGMEVTGGDPAPADKRRFGPRAG